MNYLSYNEYQNYGGTLSMPAFNNYGFIAEGIVNRYTFNRLIGETDIPEAVKRVVYSLIDIADKQNQAMSSSGTVTSRSNDGVSESYGAMSPDSVYQALSAQVGDIVTQGLSGVRTTGGKRLLYRGLYPDE